MVSIYRKEIKSYMELIPNKIEISEVHHGSVDSSSQLQHRCSSDPDLVRQEVEILRSVC